MADVIRKKTRWMKTIKEGWNGLKEKVFVLNYSFHVT